MSKFEVLILLTLSIGLTTALSDEMQKIVDTLHNQCVGETGVPEDLIEKARIGDFADDERLKCYMKCFMDASGVIQDDGKIDIEGLIALVPDEYKSVMDPVIRKCDTQVGVNLCESMWLTQKCYYDERGAEYYLP